MTRKKVLVFFLILFAFISSFVLLNRERYFGKKIVSPYEISVICRSSSTASSTSVRQGMEQAAKDLNAEISFITLQKENSAEEQVSLLKREIRNGADAVVISPVNSEDLEQPVREAMKSVPVIAMQSTVESIPNLPLISCDNEKLGSALAQAAAGDGKNLLRIAILRNSMDCSSIRRRYDGVMKILDEGKNKIEYWDIPNGSQQAYDTAKGMLLSSAADTVIALDASTLEAVAKAEQDLSKSGFTKVRIFGIGRTDTIVSLLDSRIIRSVGVENEYNLGYLSIQAAVDKINKKPDSHDPSINFAVINQENMYSSENQRLLFPFSR
ncbi:sugar ABC transporter substrate-binding protein [Caproiciproducens galactitolivorans]|uniref:TMAO reductase system periplasmic protein TorT n=1 Tax=Caproiciproducens galactitolivorans TaxID=642589 RepID=A0A4Z0Y9S8_9FIRM|nr:substrate-binding domain-containing protein [Caproiciproducens galactitolivorans]QEY34987.1 sugar ABC transporter substrate-binding protein [Caproiciproducens galactitolivorans]TGJ76305.1 TMAO reductase system periplasmic protein TorT [Caproiciproducens galactitolivorans]